MVVLRIMALGAALALLASCNQRFWVCASTDPASTGRLPARLSETGLFAPDGGLADGVRPYRPAHALWSDGADKRRWVRLPAGAVIDTSDPDDWRLPVGTRLWKEFSLDGVRIETRVLDRWGPGDGDWTALAYLWSADRSDAVAAPFGAQDALGTTHDVPASGECVACHGGRHSFALGFSALQLAHAADGDELTLGELLASGALSTPVAPVLTVPGDATEQAALGYLHANCGHCHNQRRPAAGDAPRCFEPRNELDFWLRVDHLAAPGDTPTYASLGAVVSPGRPGDSRLIDLVSHRGLFKQMPPLATERVDDAAVATLRAWIEGMR